MPPLEIVTVSGTCTQEVSRILSERHARLHVVKSYQEATEVPFDGLILLGGSDVSPFFYGETSHWSGEGENESTPNVGRRDILEWTLVRRAFCDDLPVLGLCRGHQLLSVAGGGALHQDIMRDTGEPHGLRSHGLVNVIPELRQHIPTTTVNSLHHQAVKSVPFGFRAAAFAPDGTIEAVYRPGVLGVQWHPEMLFRQDPAWGQLFDWFLAGLR